MKTAAMYFFCPCDPAESSGEEPRDSIRVTEEDLYRLTRLNVAVQGQLYLGPVESKGR